MTPEELQAIKDRLSKRSPGKWVAVENNQRCPLPAGVPVAVHMESSMWDAAGGICDIIAQGKDGKYSSETTAANAYFIAAAPSDIQALIDEVESLQIDLDRIRQNYGHPVEREGIL